MFQVLLPPGPLSARWRAAVRRAADILTVYGHGLLIYGVTKLFAGEASPTMAAALILGLACHLAACYMSYAVESDDGP